MVFSDVHVQKVFLPKGHVAELAKVLELIWEMNILHMLLSTATITVDLATKLAKDSNPVTNPFSVLGKVGSCS